MTSHSRSIPGEALFFKNIVPLFIPGARLVSLITVPQFPMHVRHTVEIQLVPFGGDV